MTLLSLLAAADGGPIGPIAKTFGANVPALISNVISFLLVALILKTWAIPPIQAMLEERRKRIAEGLANAEKTKAELAGAQARAQEIIRDAGQQATKIIEEARAVGQREIEKSSQAAIATANQIVAKARESNEAELVRMKAELRREMGRLVAHAAARATGDILTPEQQGRLSADAVKHLSA